MHQPIKRHIALQPLSRQHHRGLLFCWKIKSGIRKNIDPDRMKNYADWFFKNHLVPHFRVEEQKLFPILGSDHEMVSQALSEHTRLKELFQFKSDKTKTMELIASELDDHIRFEERILFNQLQEVATEEELQLLKTIHEEIDCEAWEDEFWK